MSSSQAAQRAVRVTLVRSRFGRSPAQTASLEALGLRKIRQVRVMKASPGVLGNVRRVTHLVRVEAVEGKH